MRSSSTSSPAPRRAVALDDTCQAVPVRGGGDVGPRNSAPPDSSPDSFLDIVVRYRAATSEAKATGRRPRGGDGSRQKRMMARSFESGLDEMLAFEGFGHALAMSGARSMKGSTPCFNADLPISGAPRLPPPAATKCPSRSAPLDIARQPFRRVPLGEEGDTPVYGTWLVSRLRPASRHLLIMATNASKEW